MVQDRPARRRPMVAASSFSFACSTAKRRRSPSTRLRFPSVAGRALPLGRRKLRAYPTSTSTTYPRRPSFSTSSLRTMRISGSLGTDRLVRGERQEGQGACPLHRPHDLALVLGAGARDAPREDLGALGDESLQQADVLVIDE